MATYGYKNMFLTILYHKIKVYKYNSFTLETGTAENIGMA